MTGMEVHAEVTGPEDAPVVLLSGSLGSTLSMWDPQVVALAERFRVVRFDTRGHGRSPVPPGPYSLDDLVDDAVALLDRLGVARAHVVGLSLGGMTALRLAAREPSRVDRLAVLCTSALLGPSQGWRDRAAAVRAGGTSVVAEAVVDRWFTPSFARADVLAELRQMVAATPAEGYAACCEAIAGMDLRAELPSVLAPTLVVGGAHDPATPVEHQQLIADGIAGARLLVVPDAAHLANIEQPTAVTTALLTHLDPAGTTVRQRGEAIRRRVLGDVHVDRATSATPGLTAPFQELITSYAWGEVWVRPGLELRTRSLLTLALLSALGHEHELALHLRAARRLGVTDEQITEVLLHTAVYAGVPAANRAFAVAQQVFAEEAP